MSIARRYWLVWSPALILAGFIGGMFGLAALFIPSFAAYYGHRKKWGVGKFAGVATLATLALFSLAVSRPG
jgi:hypothetical protein